MEYFSLKQHNTNIRTEVRAGIVSFISMAYILVVNPSILSTAGMDYNAVFIATIVASVLSTLTMAIYAKLPIALAPGIGMNSFFVVVISRGFGGSWQIALLATYLSGVLALVLIKLKVSENITNCIPVCIRQAITMGIGGMIVLLGLKAGGIQFVKNGSLSIKSVVLSPNFLVLVIGIILIRFIYIKNEKADIFQCMILALLIGVIGNLLYDYINNKASYDIFATQLCNKTIGFCDLSLVAFKFPKLETYFLSAKSFIGFILTIFIMSTNHFFDSFGTITALTDILRKTDKNFDEKSVEKGILVDQIGSVISGCVGTSTVTSYAENVVGIICGGKTGLCAIVVAACFVLSLPFSPFFVYINSYIVAPVLLFSGIVLFNSVKKKVCRDWCDAISFVLVCFYIVIRNSIVDAVIYGMLVYIVINLLRKKKDRLGSGWYLFLVIGVLNLALSYI